MTETYILKDRPAIPCPHDCVVKEIRAEGDYLLLVFDDEIALQESIQYIRPQARSLVIRVHLYWRDYTIYKQRFGRLTGYQVVNQARVLGRQRKRVEYLHHYVALDRIIIVLSEYVICAEGSAVDFIWTDR